MLIAVGSVEGSLTAGNTQGDIDIHLTNHTKVEVTAQSGHVNITVPETVSSQVEIITEDLGVDDSLILDIQSRDMKATSIEGWLS
jgi:hypothetical protein